MASPWKVPRGTARQAACIGKGLPATVTCLHAHICVRHGQAAAWMRAHAHTLHPTPPRPRAQPHGGYKGTPVNGVRAGTMYFNSQPVLLRMHAGLRWQLPCAGTCSCKWDGNVTGAVCTPHCMRRTSHCHAWSASPHLANVPGRVKAPDPVPIPFHKHVRLHEGYRRQPCPPGRCRP